MRPKRRQEAHDRAGRPAVPAHRAHGADANQPLNRRNPLTGPIVQLSGLPPMTVVSADAAEQLTYVLCMPAEGPMFFSDDVLTTCCFCGRAIRHRPHAPKRPKKLCLDCARTLDEEAA
jgi:hypothetical protein